MKRCIFAIITVAAILLAPAVFVTNFCLAADNPSPQSSQELQLDPAAQVQNDGETVSLAFAIIKVFASLSLVVGIMLIIAFLFRKMGMSGGKMKEGSLIQVLESRMIAPKKYVAVLQVGGEFLALGITDQNISLLKPLEQNEMLTDYLNSSIPPASVSLGTSFSSLLQKATKSLNQSNKQEEG